MLALSVTLLLLAEASLAIRVYLHPPLHASLASSTASPTQARLLVSHHLGLDSFDSWDDVDESVERIIAAGSLVGSGPTKALVLTVGEDVATDIIPPTFKQSFSISNPPAAAAEISSTLNAFTLRAEHFYSSIFTSNSDTFSPPIPRLLDTFSADPSEATEAFLSEMAQLVSFVESDEVDSFGSFELSGVADIAAEHGRTSGHYKLAASTANTLLSSALSNPKLHVALLTYPTTPFPSSKRQPQNQGNSSSLVQPPQSPLPPPSPAPQLPIGGVSTCYSSEDTCVEATGTCSGRGECAKASKAGRTCFVCSCNATVDDAGRRTWWVGNACEKRDISSTFTLITGTVITLLILAGGSVSLLYSVGDQKLPSTLTAGSVGGHLKRD